MRHCNTEIDVSYKSKLGELNTTFLAYIDNVINQKYWEMCLTLTMQQWGILAVK